MTVIGKINKNNFQTIKRTVVVEIGNDWLKIIENVSGRITKADCKKLVEIKGSVSEAINKIFQKLSLGRQSIILCIPRHLVTVRILELPSVNADEIRGMVNLQVGKQTPYSKEEIIFDHKILGEGRKGYSRIMLVIARRNLIDDRVETLQAAGITIQKIAVSSDGLYQWFGLACSVKKDEDAIALIDVDSNYSNFNIIYQNKLVFTRNILIGSNNFFTDRSKWEDKFLTEIEHARDLYLHEDGGIKISRVILSGAARSIEDLNRLLSLKLDVPVEVVNPSANIQTRGNIDIFQYEHFNLVSMCPLIGMAVHSKALEFDLTPNELQIERLMEEKRKQFTIMGGVVGAIVLMISLLLLINIYNKNSYLNQLKTKIAAISKEANAVEKMRLCIDLVENRLSAKKRSLNILYETYRLTPKEVYFTNINLEEGKQVVLQGRAFAMSNVFEFVTTLENSPFFENVKTTYTTTKKEKKVEYAKFEIICMFEDENE